MRSYESKSLGRIDSKENPTPTSTAEKGLTQETRMDWQPFPT